MRTFLEKYGIAIFTLVIIAILLALASPFGIKLKGAVYNKFDNINSIAKKKINKEMGDSSNNLIKPEDGNEVIHWNIGPNGNDTVVATLYESGKLIITGEGDTLQYANSSDVPWLKEHSDSITSVVIADDVKPSSMANWFTNCSNLTEINKIPDSVTDLTNTFKDCTKLNGELDINLPNLEKCDNCFTNAVTDSSSKLLLKGDSPQVEMLFNTKSDTSNIITEMIIGTEIQHWDIGKEEPDKVIATLYTSGQLVFTGEGDTQSYTSYNGSPWYSNNSKIKSVIFNDTVKPTDISYWFYGCSNLIHVNKIPDSVTSIGTKTFCNCKNLKSIDIPLSVESIESDAFGYCHSLKSIDIPSSVESIESKAFESCSKLKTINLPEGLKTIKSMAFAYLPAMSNIIIPSTVEQIGSQAFYESGLITIDIPNTVKTIGGNAFYNCKKLESFIITDYTIVESSSTSPTDAPFYTCTALKDVTLNIIKPGDMKNYSEFGSNMAPWGNIRGQITNINISNKVTSLGSYTFSYCSNIETIKIPNSITKISYNAFAYSSIRNIEIPESVKTIGTNAFYRSNKLETVILPNGLKTIESEVFRESGLKTLTIPNTVETIGSYAFYSSNLTNIEIPNSVKTIGSFAFAKSKLITVNIPSTVQTLGGNAFNSCEQLETFSITDNTIVKSGSGGTNGYSPLNGCTSLKKLTLNLLNIESIRYMNSSGNPWYYLWYNSITDINIGNGATSILDNAFNGFSKLTSITIPDSVTSISSTAFKSCTGLTDIYYNGSATGQPWGATNATVKPIPSNS